MNKIAVIANARFEKGLIAFINSYKKAVIESPLVIIDTGLENSYPYETIKKSLNQNNLKKASWMADCSPYLQCELADIEADKIIYLEVDMLILKNIDHLFNEITDKNVIAVMDDAARATYITDINYIDNCGRYFIEGSELSKKYLRYKGYNGGLIGGTKEFYIWLRYNWKRNYLDKYENQYRLLAQSLLNQYFIEENICVKDIGLEYNFSGINEYYDCSELYNIIFNGKNWEISFDNIEPSIIHFTGKNKPFLIDEKNIMTPVFDYYYNNGRLFDV